MPGDGRRNRPGSARNNTWIRTWYEVQQREPIWINPSDAKERGIANGDVVRVYNDRGSLLGGAMVTDRVRAGVVILREGAWYDPDNAQSTSPTCKHGLVNVVTLDKGTSQLAQGNISNTVLVEVAKHTGPIPAITAFQPPRIV
jgi:trimethylamine-N-oxide reductase (cytochrome c)